MEREAQAQDATHLTGPVRKHKSREFAAPGSSRFYWRCRLPCSLPARPFRDGVSLSTASPSALVLLSQPILKCTSGILQPTSLAFLSEGILALMANLWYRQGQFPLGRNEDWNKVSWRT